jgi:hypothetical protein
MGAAGSVSNDFLQYDFFFYHVFYGGKYTAYNPDYRKSGEGERKKCRVSRIQ